LSESLLRARDALVKLYYHKVSHTVRYPRIRRYGNVLPRKANIGGSWGGKI